MLPVRIFENEDFIAVDKPAGLLSIPDRQGEELSLKQILAEQTGEIFTVHRLDKDTSGLILFAKNAESHRALSAAFQERAMEKYYTGLVQGRLVNENGQVDAPIMEHPGKLLKMITHAKGKPSLTEYTVLKAFRQYAWLQFRIHTGRTHQIRVHMQHIGHPIACDPIYGDGQPILLSALKKNFKLAKAAEEERPLLNRLALHSQKLVFDLNGEHFEIEAPVPKDLRATIQQLEKWAG